MIRIACPSCGQKFAAEEDQIGRMAACPRCRGRFRVEPTRSFPLAFYAGGGIALVMLLAVAALLVGLGCSLIAARQQRTADHQKETKSPQRSLVAGKFGTDVDWQEEPAAQQEIGTRLVVQDPSVPVLPRFPDYDPAKSGFNPQSLRKLYRDAAGNRQVQHNVLYKLARNSGSDEDLDLYREATQHGNPEIRFLGAYALANWRQDVPDAVRILVDCLHDKYLTRGVPAIGGRGALPMLQLLRPSRAEELFDAFGPEEMVPIWTMLCGDTDEFCRAYAVQQLARLGPVAGDSVPAVASLLSDDRVLNVSLPDLRGPKPVNQIALDALGIMLPFTADALPAIENVVADQAQSDEFRGKALELALQIHFDVAAERNAILTTDRSSIGLPFLPPSTRHVAFVNIGSIEPTDAYRSALESDAALKTTIDDLEDLTGIALADVDSLLMGTTYTAKCYWAARPLVIVARMNRAEDAESVLSAVGTEGSIDAGKHKVHLLGDDWAIANPEACFIVFGDRATLVHHLSQPAPASLPRFDWLEYRDYDYVVVDASNGAPDASIWRYDGSASVLERQRFYPSRQLAEIALELDGEGTERLEEKRSRAIDHLRSILERLDARLQRQPDASSDPRRQQARDALMKQIEELEKNVVITQEVERTRIVTTVRLDESVITSFDGYVARIADRFLSVEPNDEPVEQLYRILEAVSSGAIGMNDARITTALSKFEHVRDWRREETATLLQSLLLFYVNGSEESTPDSTDQRRYLQQANRIAGLLGKWGGSAHASAIAGLANRRDADLYYPLMVQCLGSIHTPEAIELLEQITRDKTDLSFGTVPMGIADRVAFYARHGDNKTSVAACQVLGRMKIHGRPHVATLAFILADDSIPSGLRKAAIAAWSQIMGTDPFAENDKSDVARREIVIPDGIEYQPGQVDEWQWYTAVDDSFTVRVPAQMEPIKMAASASDGRGNYREIILRLTDRRGAGYEVYVLNRKRDDDEWAAWNSASRQLGDFLIKDRPVETHSAVCRERFYQRDGIFRAQRLYVTNRRTYRLTWNGKGYDNYPEDVRKFFDSLEWKW